MSTFQQFFPGGGSSSGGGLPATTTVAEVLVVGGGQSGNMSCIPGACPGSGGTGGGVLMSSGWNFEQGCVYTVTVGSGGPSAAPGAFKPGTDSSIIGYNAPPMALVGRAAQCYTAGSCGHAATVPTHTVNANTFHYGTETCFVERFCSPSPPSDVLGNVAAGGAGHPGGAPCMAAIQNPTGFWIATKNLLYPGGNGMYSDITGTGAYYGPGGHGTTSNPGQISVINMSSKSIPIPAGCLARRPTISCAGCVGSPSDLISACANYGAGGAGQSFTCGCPQAAGGSGIVFVRYPTEYNAAASVTGNTPTPAQPGYHVYRFNGDGSITF
jgi:hypothetical protein